MDRQIIRNSFLFSGSQIVGRIIGFGYFVFLARMLSVADFGIYSWTLGFVYNFYPLADFGLERLVLKKIPREPEKTAFYLQRLLPLRVALALVAIFLSLTLGIILDLPAVKISYIFLFGLTMIPSNLIFMIAFFENAHERSETYAKATVAIPILAAIFGSLVIYFHLNLIWLFISYASSTAIVFLFLARRLRLDSLSLRWIIDLDFSGQILKESRSFAIITIMAVFYLRLSLLLVGKLLGDYSAGIYGAASKFVEAGILIPQGVALALFPLSSKLLILDRERLKNIYRRGLAILFLLSLPAAGLMFFGSKMLVPLFYGPQYHDTIPVFSLLGIVLVFLFLNSLAGNIIQNSEKIKKFIPVAMANLLVAFLAGIWLIPQKGVIGGVWAMLIGEIFGLVANNYFVSRILHEKP